MTIVDRAEWWRRSFERLFLAGVASIFGFGYAQWWLHALAAGFCGAAIYCALKAGPPQ